MPKFNDVEGRQFVDFYKGDAYIEIIERSDGYIDAVDGKAWYFSAYKYWPKGEKKAMGYACGRVLDIGCGMGRHALHLQKKGLDVTGIDCSPSAVGLCKQRGLKKVKVLPIERIDKFQPASFDSIIMMGNNFGLFGSFKKAKTLLRKMRRITAPDARIIAETLNPYNTTNPDHLRYHKLNRKSGRMGGQIRLRCRYKGFIGPWFDYLFVSESELLDILSGTGWKLEKIIRSVGPRYIAVIEKSAKAGISFERVKTNLT